MNIDCSLSFVGQVVHSMLMHEIKSSNRDEILFKFNAKFVSFPLEFELIMGLNCGENSSNFDVGPYINRLLELYFPGKSSISRDELKQFFTTQKEEVRYDGNAIKLAKVFLIENFLLSKRGNSKVNNFVLA